MFCSDVFDIVIEQRGQNAFHSTSILEKSHN